MRQKDILKQINIFFFLNICNYIINIFYLLIREKNNKKMEKLISLFLAYGPNMGNRIPEIGNIARNNAGKTKIGKYLFSLN